jgi:hypothetical protein
MATNSDIEVRLRAIVEDFRLPGGGLKEIGRLVANHLDWFEAAEARGMTWRDMIRALSAAGVTGREGKPLSVGTLSSAVWRASARCDLVEPPILITQSRRASDSIG